MANKFTDAEVFATDCPALGLDYLFSDQGLAVHIRFTVQNTQTVSGHDGRPMNISEAPGIPVVVSAASGERLIVVSQRTEPASKRDVRAALGCDYYVLPSPKT